MMRQFRRTVAFAAAFFAAIATTNLQAAPGKITFTVSGYTGAKTFENFIVPVRLAAGSPDGFTYTDCAADGSDIVFYDANNVEIPYEIDTWNTAGTSILWVRLPSMTAGTTFTMEYGVGDVKRATATTDTWADYGAVFHMTDNTDSAGGANGTFVDPRAANPTDGFIGQCHGSYASGDYKEYKKGPILQIPYNDKFGAMATPESGSAFTISGWMKRSNTATYWCWLYVTKEDDPDATGFGLQYRGKNGAHDTLATWTDATDGDKYTTAYSNAGKNLWTGSWAKFDAVYSGSTMTLYVNGVSVGTGTNYGSKPAKFYEGDTFNVGAQPGAKNPRTIPAWFDEIRIRGEVLDADFIRAQYNAENDAGFLSAEYASLASFAVTVNPVTYDANAGQWVVPVVVKAGSGDLKCVFVDDLSAETEITFGTGVSEGAYSYGLTGLAADKVYSVTVVATGGGETFEYLAGSIYTGSLTLSASSVVPLCGGTFTFRRAVGGAAISFPYTVGGTAVAGVDYRPISGVVTFAAGSDTANVDITVNDAPAVDPDATVTLSMEGFPCTPASATLSLAGIYPVYDAKEFDYNIDFTVAGDISGTLENFPVLVRMNTTKFPSLDWDALGENGENLVFLDPDGNRLYAEVEKCSKADGELIAWVRLPQIATGAKFTAAWGSVAVNAIPSAGTWKDYGGVWHMNGFAEVDGAYVVADSAGAFGEDGKTPMDAIATIAPVETEGPIGGALYGSTKEFILTAPDYDPKYDTAFECSFWYYSPDQNFTSLSQSYRLFCKEEGYESGFGWYFTQKWSTSGLADVARNSQMSFFASTDGGNTGYITINSGHDPRYGWGYVQLFVTNGTATVFMNGSQVATKSGMTINPGDWPFQILFETSRRDEVRLRKYPSKDAAVVAAWQKAEYDSLTDGNFVTGLFKANRGLSPATATVSGNATDGFTLDTEISGDATGELYFVVRGADGVTTNLYTDAATAGEYSIPLASALAANASYKVSALTKVGSIYNELAADDTFYTGELSISAGGDADAFTHKGSEFTISRATGDAAGAFDLVVHYTVGGTAENGVDFAELSGTAVIPAGESSVILPIDPILHGGASADDLTLSIALTDGFYGVASAASSAQIGFHTVGEVWLLSSDKKTITDNSWTLNVSLNDGKVSVNGVKTAGANTTLRFDWDVMDADGTRYHIRAIGGSAFNGNKVVKLVKFRDDLESIGYAAFQSCTSLGGEYRFGFNGAFAFGTGGNYAGDGYNFASTRIEKVEMGEGVATIPSHAFKSNTNLKTVVLPPALDKVPYSCFDGCTGLKTVTPFLPETVASVAYRAFYNCTSLTGDLQCASVDGFTFGVDKEGSSGGNSDAFRNTKITSATIGNGLTTRLPSHVFDGCTALKTVRLPDTLPSTIGWYAFYGCSALETVTPLLPYGVTDIGYQAFYNCTKLTGNLVIDGTEPFKFSLNNNISQAFQGAKLDSVYFGANVTNVAAQAFIACTTIKEMRFTKIIPVAANAFGNLPDYQAKVYFDKLDPGCVAFLADSTKVTPWAELDAATQKLYTDAHPDEKHPIGLTTDATNLRKSWAFGFWSENPGTMIMLK